MISLIDELTNSYSHLFLSGLLIWIIWRVGSRIIDERPLRDHFPVAAGVLDVIILPIVVIVTGSLARVANRAIGDPGLDSIVLIFTQFFAYLTIAWALARIVELRLARGLANRGSIGVPRLLVGLLYGTFLAVAVAVFLNEQGYSFTGVWVSTGVAAAVLGLALQSTLGDLFSGIAMQIEGPFRIGDWIELQDGTLGQVVDMNWRATHLRGWDNATRVIPNAQMAKTTIKNYRDEHHLYAPWYFVDLPAEVSPRFAQAMLLEAALRCETVLDFPYPVVRLVDAKRPPYRYMVWVHFANYPAMFRGREELYREIHEVLRQAGIASVPEVHEVRTRRAPSTTAEPPTIELALRGLEIAPLFSDAEIERLAQRGEYHYHNAGQVLLAADAVSDAVYVVAGGLVEASIHLTDGSRKVMETLGPGKYFGMASTLSTQPSVEEFVATSDVTLIRIDLDCLRDIVSERPDLAEALTLAVQSRLKAAEAARGQSRKPLKRMSLSELRTRVEERLRQAR